jgi:hypothetical protein
MVIFHSYVKLPEGNHSGFDGSSTFITILVKWIWMLHHTERLNSHSKQLETAA